MRIKGYELYSLRTALRKAVSIKDLPANIEEEDSYESYRTGGPIKFGINYWASGFLTAEKAVEYGEQIKKCAEYATKLNELELMIDKESGWDLTRDDLDKLTLKYIENICNWELPEFEGGAQ